GADGDGVCREGRRVVGREGGGSGALPGGAGASDDLAAARGEGHGDGEGEETEEGAEGRGRQARRPGRGWAADMNAAAQGFQRTWAGQPDRTWHRMAGASAGLTRALDSTPKRLVRVRARLLSRFVAVATLGLVLAACARGRDAFAEAEALEKAGKLEEAAA